MFLFPFRKSLSAALAAGAVLVLGFLLNLPCASGQNADVASASRRARIDEALKGMNRGKSVGQVAISPDGKRLAWIENFRDAAEIRVAPPNDLAKNERVTVATSADQRCHEGEIAWEPDSKALAFFSDCADQAAGASGPLSFAAGWQPGERLTAAGVCGFNGILSGWEEGRVSLCGRRNAAGRCTGGHEAAIRRDWRGRRGDSAGGGGADRCSAAAPAQVTPANLHVYEFDWAPDSKGMAYVAADPPGENNWWVAKLYTQTLDGAAASRFWLPPRCPVLFTDCRSPCRAGRRTERRSPSSAG